MLKQIIKCVAFLFFMYSLWCGMVLLGLLDTLSVFSVNVYSVSSFAVHSVLFCCLAVLDPRVGHTMDALSPFIFVVYSVLWGGYDGRFPDLFISQ